MVLRWDDTRSVGGCCRCGGVLDTVDGWRGSVGVGRSLRQHWFAQSRLITMYPIPFPVFSLERLS